MDTPGPNDVSGILVVTMNCVPPPGCLLSGATTPATALAPAGTWTSLTHRVRLLVGSASAARATAADGAR